MDIAMLIMSCCGNLDSDQILLASTDSAALEVETRSETSGPNRRDAAAVAPRFL